jgi:hypothetical protein
MFRTTEAGALATLDVKRPSASLRLLDVLREFPEATKLGTV